jgi:hypothetical protein
MSGFPNSPRLVKGGIVTLDPDTLQVTVVYALVNTDVTQVQTFVFGGSSSSTIAAMRNGRPPSAGIRR